jgi:hypothetical protein
VSSLKPVIHGRDHLPGGSDPIPVTSSGLPNAVMIKTASQTVAGNTTAAVTMDSSTFATTDSSIFTVSGNDIVVNANGLYASYIHFVPDSTNPDPLQTQFYTKWITASGGANAPWEQIVPRNFNVNGPAGLPGFQPDGVSLLHSLANLELAYCSSQPVNVKTFLATLDASSIDLTTCLLIVVQLQPIASFAGFPSYPV